MVDNLRLPEWWPGNRPFVIDDCRKGMRSLPESSIDLIVTSPPYNAGMEYEDDMTPKQYKRFIDSSCREMARVLKHRLCLNVGFDSKYNKHSKISGKKSPDSVPIGYQWFQGLEKAGLVYRDTIVWHKVNSQNDTAWGTFQSSRSPWMRHETEIILVFYKGPDWGLPPGVSDLTKNEFLQWTYNLWKMNYAQRLGHPCPYPIDLAVRCIKLFSYPGMTVLDPFLGQGTTLLASRMTGRIGLGFEKDPKYEKVISTFAREEVTQITDWSMKKNYILEAYENDG